jgi:transcription-repair coupling factor (superfamily II helicase)
MEAIGFDYYMHLLEQTVKELKGEHADEVKTEINLKVNIRIPDDYLPQTNLRLNLYKRISSVETIEDMEKIRKEIIDRFGPLPQPVQTLVCFGIIKFLSQEIRIKTIDRVGQKIVFKFFPTSTIDLVRMTGVLEKHNGSITPQGVMTIMLPSSDDTNIMIETISFLKELSGM